MCDDEVQITRAKAKPEIQKRQLVALISCLEQRSTRQISHALHECRPSSSSSLLLQQDSITIMTLFLEITFTSQERS